MPVSRPDRGRIEEDDEDMTNDLHPTSPVPPVPPATTVPLMPPPTAGVRKRSAGHIVAIVAGCLMLVPGLGMLTGGGALALAQGVATDGDGYFRVTLDRVESDGVAIATTDLWDEQVEDEDWPWALDFLDLDVRLRVDGAAGTDDVFVGIARSADVEGYLDGVAHTEVTDIRDHTPISRPVPGRAEVAAPGEADFWVVSTAGSGEQELTWDARGGRWSIVVMNADGAPGVGADVEFGVRSGAVVPIAVTLLVLGSLTVTLSVVLIVVGTRGRRSPGRPLLLEPAPFPDPSPGAAADRDGEHASIG